MNSFLKLVASIFKPVCKRAFKIALLLSFCFLPCFLFGAKARAWTKVIDCPASDTVVDQQLSGQGQDFQIVFRNLKIVGQLLESGAVATKRLTSLNEIVLMIKENETQPGEWIGEADAFSASGVVYFIRPAAGRLTFVAYRTAQSSAQSYLILDKLGHWQMNDCRRVDAATVGL